MPTRAGVTEYRQLAQQINELVGRINGPYGTLEYSPIHYINQSVTQEELFAIYELADVCLVTSVRDGMNLVSYEYVAAQSAALGLFNEDPNSNPLSSSANGSGGSGGGLALGSGGGAGLGGEEGGEGWRQTTGPGVLILSEFAGSAQSLSGALRVNPWNTEEVAHTIHQALSLSRVERDLRHTKLHRYVSSKTAANWALTFMTEFRNCINTKPSVSKLPKTQVNRVARSYERARNRLIIVDYDATLMARQLTPDSPPRKDSLTLLDTLCKDPKNTVFVMSGRCVPLPQYCSDRCLPVCLCACVPYLFYHHYRQGACVHESMVRTTAAGARCGVRLLSSHAG